MKILVYFLGICYTMGNINTLPHDSDQLSFSSVLNDANDHERLSFEAKGISVRYRVVKLEQSKVKALTSTARTNSHFNDKFNYICRKIDNMASTQIITKVFDGIPNFNDEEAVEFIVTVARTSFKNPKPYNIHEQNITKFMSKRILQKRAWVPRLYQKLYIGGTGFKSLIREEVAAYGRTENTRYMIEIKLDIKKPFYIDDRIIYQQISCLMWSGEDAYKTQVYIIEEYAMEYRNVKFYVPIRDEIINILILDTCDTFDCQIPYFHHEQNLFPMSQHH